MQALIEVIACGRAGQVICGAVTEGSPGAVVAPLDYPPAPPM